jgi:hypothetical protein
MALEKATRWKVKREQDGDYLVYRMTPAYGFHPESVRRKGIEERYGTYERRKDAAEDAAEMNRKNPGVRTNKRGARKMRKSHGRAKKLMKSGHKKMAAWVRSEGKRNPAVKSMTVKQVAAALRKKGLSSDERNALERRRNELRVMREHVREADRDARIAQKRRNPVRVSATMSGKSTGWIPSKATRVIVKGGRHVVEVKR